MTLLIKAIHANCQILISQIVNSECARGFIEHANISIITHVDNTTSKDSAYHLVFSIESDALIFCSDSFEIWRFEKGRGTQKEEEEIDAENWGGGGGTQKCMANSHAQFPPQIPLSPPDGSALERYGVYF